MYAYIPNGPKGVLKVIDSEVPNALAAVTVTRNGAHTSGKRSGVILRHRGMLYSPERDVSRPVTSVTLTM